MTDTSPHMISGRCLCGAVTIEVALAAPRMRACHCDMCRQHTSMAFTSLDTVIGSEVVNGPVKTYRSSDWPERGFCEVCGSTLWYSTVHDGARYISAGRFPDSEKARLSLEFYADEALAPIAGTHKKMTGRETRALFAAEEGDAT